MKILLDENITPELSRCFSAFGYQCFFIQSSKFASIKNGKMLASFASLPQGDSQLSALIQRENFDVFITQDTTQHLETSPQVHELLPFRFGVIVLCAKSNRIEDIEPVLLTALRNIENGEQGEYRSVGNCRNALGLKPLLITNGK